jgi:hypothetical protein
MLQKLLTQDNKVFSSLCSFEISRIVFTSGEYYMFDQKQGKRNQCARDFILNSTYNFTSYTLPFVESNKEGLFCSLQASYDRHMEFEGIGGHFQISRDYMDMFLFVRICLIFICRIKMKNAPLCLTCRFLISV